MSDILPSAVSIAILTTIVGVVFSSIVTQHTNVAHNRDWNKNHVMEMGLFLSSFIAVLIHVYVVIGQGRFN